MPIVDPASAAPGHDESKQKGPPRPVDPMIGRNLLGQFVIKQRLGEGGMGTAYLADQVGMDRLAVVKVLHPHLLGDSRWVERFNREAKVASKLNHPNCITLYNFGRTEEGYVYIAMEYVDGPSLSTIIEKEGPIKVERATQIAIHICGALHQAHELGIVHRDLKPDNILLTTRGKQEIAKVLDFGIAKLQGGGPDEKQLTATGMIFGTPAYMSPEQFAGGELDGRSDLYSLGVILFEMLAGRRPFQASSPIGYFRLHQDEIPPPLRVANPEVSVPRELERLVFKVLQKDRSSRFRDAEEMAHELELVLARVEVESSSPEIGDPLPGLQRDLPMAAWLDQLERSAHPSLTPSARAASGLSGLLDRLEAEAAASSPRPQREEKLAPGRIRIGDAPPHQDGATPRPETPPPAEEGKAARIRVRKDQPPGAPVLLGGSAQRLSIEPATPSEPARAAQPSEAAPSAAVFRPTPAARGAAAPAAQQPIPEVSAGSSGDDEDVAVIIDTRIELPRGGPAGSHGAAAPGDQLAVAAPPATSAGASLATPPAASVGASAAAHPATSPPATPPPTSPAAPSSAPVLAEALASAPPAPAQPALPALFSYRTERREEEAPPPPLAPPPPSPVFDAASRSRVRPIPLMSPPPRPDRSPYLKLGIFLLLVSGMGFAGYLYGPEMVAYWRKQLPEKGKPVSGASVSLPVKKPGDTPVGSRHAEEQMVLIPATTFTMGHKDIPGASPHPVELEPFLIDREEVTNAAYRPCVTARHCFESAFVNDPTFNGPELPVVGVSFDDAQTFCRWRGRRLPSEAEWERAARGPEGLLYPWGDAFKPGKANVAGSEDGAVQTAPTSSFAVGASPEGLLNMAGNVAEWVADSYGTTDQYPRKRGPDPREDASDDRARVRGGSWVSEPDKTMASHRGERLSRDTRRFTIGFRCAGTVVQAAAAAGSKGPAETASDSAAPEGQEQGQEQR